MPTKEKKKLLFIINPISGHGKGKTLEAIIKKHIDYSVYDVTICFSNYPSHPAQLAKEAVNRSFDIVAAAGGDGTVNQVASQLVGTATALAIIPIGSGNGLARHLRIPMNTGKAVAMINHEQSHPVDSCKVNDYFFFSIAGVGYDAKIAYDFNHGKGRGFEHYVKHILDNYFTYQSENYIITINKRPYSKQAFFIAFANSSQWGFNVKASPKASIEDGLIDVCFFSKPHWFELSNMLIKLLSNRIDTSKWVSYIKCKEITVKSESGNPIYLHIDGEAVEPANTLHVRVIPSNLNVICP